MSRLAKYPLHESIRQLRTAYRRDSPRINRNPADSTANTCSHSLNPAAIRPTATPAAPPSRRSSLAEAIYPSIRPNRERSAKSLRKTLQKHVQQMRPAVLRAELSVMSVETTSHFHGFSTSRRAPCRFLSDKCTIENSYSSSPNRNSSSPTIAPRPFRLHWRAQKARACISAGRTECRSSDTRGPRSFASCSARYSDLERDNAVGNAVRAAALLDFGDFLVVHRFVLREKPLFSIEDH